MRYPVKFVEDGKWWVAEIPGVGGGGIATQGESLDEARMMAADAIVGVQFVRLKAGQSLEEPAAKLPRGKGWEWVQLPLTMEAALRIRAERKAQGLTMQAAADLVGVPLGTYERWEDPWRCKATLSTLEKVSAAFGKRIELAFV
ncbi:type II toxin-antitoxin system HicB family antitoxin [bacterium CPR1]|nr:type II toxin-antitoxin system HicB family antitoxin [bacterium CPR1]